MKPIYIMSRYSEDVRRQRATPSEVRDVVEGKSDDRLVHIEIGEDGDIVAHPLAADELKKIADDLEADRTARMRDLLDDTVLVVRKARALEVNTGSFGLLSIWAEHSPGADRIVLAWAEERGYEIKRGSPPTTGVRWYPDAEVRVEGVTVVRVVWPDREVNTPAVVEAEIATVTAERATAAAELEAF